jgi:hypothetical protein
MEELIVEQRPNELRYVGGYHNMLMREIICFYNANPFLKIRFRPGN